MEIVSEPDMRASLEAMAYVKKLRSILRYLGTCDGNMEQGSLRVDANISLRRPGEGLGTRAEIKNVNSVRFLGQAIDYEISRQLDILENGGTVVQETRLFDPGQGITRSMRSKEDAHDYRYFPDPDLPPLRLSAQRIETLKNSLPELPDVKRQRFIAQLGLSPYDSAVLVGEKEIADYYEETLTHIKAKNIIQAAKLTCNWLMGDVFAALNRDGKTIETMALTPNHLAELIDLISDETISGKIAKDLFIKLWETGTSPMELVDKLGLRQITDTSTIERSIDSVLSLNVPKVAEYKAGKEQLFGFFVGQVMKAMQGKGNPGMINELLKKKLEEAS